MKIKATSSFAAGIQCKRGVAFLGLLAIAMGALVGCSGGDSSSGTTGASGSASNSSGNGAAATVSLTGAGSTFVNPAMSKWTYTYHENHADVSINYQSVGSGAGIAQYKAGTVDFGATDAPLSDKELSEMPTPTVLVPVIAGCTVMAYNLPGVQNGLKLSSDVVAGIYLGKIKKWNDPLIVAQNTGLKLPDLDITVAHRSDGSGTTYIFTDYLCSVSPEWKSGPGMGKSVNWPVGVGGKGNEGVAGLIKQTPGCIGYVELAYAVQTKLNYGPIKNKSGEYVEPSIESTTAAANAGVEAMKKDIRTSIVNGESKDAYPIAGFTYLLVSKAPKDAAKAKALNEFLDWVFADGQKMAAELQYAPLPESVVGLNKTALADVKASQ